MVDVKFSHKICLRAATSSSLQGSIGASHRRDAACHQDHHRRSSVVHDVSIRLNEMLLAHPSTAEPMLDARHSHCSHSNNLEHVHAYPQPGEQTLQLPNHV